MTALSLSSLSSALSAPRENQGTVLAVAGGATAILGLGYLLARRSDYKKKPSSFQLSGGAVDAKKVKETVRARPDGGPLWPGEGQLELQCLQAGSGSWQRISRPPAAEFNRLGSVAPLLLPRGRQGLPKSALLLHRHPGSQSNDYAIFLGMCSVQVKEYYGEYNTLERGKGAVMKESQKVRYWRGVGQVLVASLPLPSPCSIHDPYAGLLLLCPYPPSQMCRRSPPRFIPARWFTFCSDGLLHRLHA